MPIGNRGIFILELRGIKPSSNIQALCQLTYSGLSLQNIENKFA